MKMRETVPTSVSSQRGTVGHGFLSARLSLCIAQSPRGALAGGLGPRCINLGSVPFGRGPDVLLNSTVASTHLTSAPPPWFHLAVFLLIVLHFHWLRETVVAARRKSRLALGKQMARCAARRLFLSLCSLRLSFASTSVCLSVKAVTPLSQSCKTCSRFLRHILTVWR